MQDYINHNICYAEREIRVKNAGNAMRGTKKRLQLNVLWVVFLLALQTGAAQANPYWSPWYGKDSSIVVDAYAYSPIRWKEFIKNRKLVGFINKASDGLSPPWRCAGNETKRKLCKIAWRQHKAEEELFLTRRHLAKSMGLKWGSYHLGRAGNPIQQALHYLSYAKPEKDELIALDIEDIKPGKWMSLKDAEIFARFIKLKIGRYPLLYTNHSTAKHIAQNKTKYPLLSRLNLWYARYKKKIPGTFPMGNWESYTLWQFTSQHNCKRRRCPWRMRGTDSKIDVNVVAMSRKKLRAAWPFSELTAKKNTTPEAVAEAKVVPAEPKKIDIAKVEKGTRSYEPSPPHPDADRVVIKRLYAKEKQMVSALAATPPAKIARIESETSAPIALLPTKVPEAKIVRASARLEMSPKAAEQETEIDPKYRISGRIPVPEQAPVFMEVDASDVPLPKERPYQDDDGPRHKFLDDILASIHQARPGS